LVPFTIRVVRRIHAAVKLNVHRTVNAAAARRWPRLNAGNRRQVETPVTGIRHFRVVALGVKSAGATRAPLQNQSRRAKVQIPVERNPVWPGVATAAVRSVRAMLATLDQLFSIARA